MTRAPDFSPCCPAGDFRRSRVGYALWVLLVIGAGLLWRSGVLPLSDFFAKYGGDALWALVAFLGCGFVFPRAATWRVAAMALGFAWAVEFSQLYHAGWIDDIRRTRLGHLVLGFTFNAPDLLAYAAGIAAGAAAEIWARGKSPPRGGVNGPG